MSCSQISTLMLSTAKKTIMCTKVTVELLFWVLSKLEADLIDWETSVKSEPLADKERVQH